jgi:protein TonB
MYFETTVPQAYVHEDIPDDIRYVSDPIIKTKEVAMVKTKPVVRKISRVKPPIIKKNDVKMEPVEPVITVPDIPDVNPPVVTKKAEDPIIPTGPKSIMGVEEVPIFPGCEGLEDNQERIKCMSGKLARIVQRKFNGDLAADQGLEGIQRISVQFTIDKTGNVTDIKARAPHSSLVKEAKRVMTKVPKMQPGRQDKKPVDVVYSLPIIFRVQN